MGAWKLRAIVYGMLAVVSALVLWQSGALAGDDTPETRLLKGRTDRGSAISFLLVDGRVRAFDLDDAGWVCDRSFSFYWNPYRGQPDVKWRQKGGDIEVEEHPRTRARGWAIDPYLRARVTEDGDRVEGRYWYTAQRGKRRCRSPDVAFSARRNP